MVGLIYILGSAAIVVGSGREAMGLFIFVGPVLLAVVAAFRQRIEVTRSEMVIDRGLYRRRFALSQSRLEWRWNSDRRFMWFVHLGGQLRVISEDGSNCPLPMTDFGARGPRGRSVEIAEEVAAATGLPVVDGRGARW